MPGATISINFYYVYILESLKDGKQYTGFATNLQARTKQRFDGLVVSTKPRLPMKLIYFEACLNFK
jgi:putative endonuclease